MNRRLRPKEKCQKCKLIFVDDSQSFLRAAVSSFTIARERSSKTKTRELK